MPRPKKNQEVSREVLLDAALEEFSEKGFHKTKLEDIAKRAGVSRGAIYWHFKNKEDFYISLVKSFLGDLETDLINILESDLGSLEKLKKCYIDYFNFLGSDQKFYKTKVLESKKIETWSSIDQLQVYHDEKISFWQEKISEVIENGKEKQEIDEAIDSNTAALAYISYIIGAEELYLFHNNFFEKSHCTQQLIEIFINGLRKN